MRSSIRGATVLSLIAVVAKIFQLQWSIGSFRILARFSPGERGEILYVADNLLGLMIQVGVVGSMGSLLAHWRENKYHIEDIVSFLICLGGLFVSASRGAIMGSSVGLLFLAFNYGPFVTLVAAVVLSGSLVMAAVIRKVGNFLEIFQDPVRLIIWQTTLKAIFARPLFGWGPGVFRQAFERYRPAGFTTDVTCAHSDYLNIFIGWGLVGGLIFWGWQFFILVRSWLKGLNPLQRTIAAVLIAFYVHVGVNDLFAAYAGLFLGLLQHPSFFEEKESWGIVSRIGGEKPLNAQ
ncbi:MAG: O-antigen ligase family protein [Firmicutes bacterium]|nr:O-antigen ligase family protein [Bacillota bacterium]